MRLGAMLSALAGFVLAAWLLFMHFDEALTLLVSAGAGVAMCGLTATRKTDVCNGRGRRTGGLAPSAVIHRKISNIDR